MSIKLFYGLIKKSIYAEELEQSLEMDIFYSLMFTIK